MTKKEEKEALRTAKAAEKELALRKKLDQMLTYERVLWEKGIVYVAGVDEVGRGPLAGPVCAAAVILPYDFDVLGIDDSKKISEKKRELLYDEITEHAIAWGIGMIENERIDEINILNATKEAMVIAIKAAQTKIENGTIGHLLVDAVKLSESGIHGTAIIKGDQKSVSIAAASIVAKVTRDRLMIEYDAIYPGYGFASNKGYGTATHYSGISELGLTPIHRLSFLKNL